VAVPKVEASSSPPTSGTLDPSQWRNGGSVARRDCARPTGGLQPPSHGDMPPRWTAQNLGRVGAVEGRVQPGDREVGKRMEGPHHPRISMRRDGRWVVRCIECQRSAGVTGMPIGIGLPLRSEREAQMIRENHAASMNRRLGSGSRRLAVA
jgi:hypothetical protein